jgi:hypothetical protein
MNTTESVKENKYTEGVRSNELKWRIEMGTETQAEEEERQGGIN